MRRRARPARLAVAAAIGAVASRADGQVDSPRGGGDPPVTVTVTVRHDSLPVEGAVVRALGTGAAARTDARGTAALRVAPGARALVASRLGYRPDTLRLTLAPGRDTAVVAALEALAADVEAVVVATTRADRRVEETPLRVEVIDAEEVDEKVSMTPGDIAMMLNETSGLRVQATNPSLGGASVRVQGLRGRYTLLLADGLPLYGGQAGGLGLLQVPPVDLGRVEVVKGTASALYGSSALGGVVNLISRRPDDEAARTALVNQTTRGGTDAVLFGAGPLSTGWGYTLLAGAHRQRENDLDRDGWADMPGYRRAVVRPRLFHDDGDGTTAFLTGGVTVEDRAGGTLDGRVAPDARPYEEGLRTRRGDVGALARRVLGTGPLRGAVVTARGSATEQRHRHTFGDVRERDRHGTWFGEASLAVPRGRATYVAGAAYEWERYRAADVAGFDYTYAIPAAFAQADVDATRWLSLSASARADAHSDYGTFVNPRLSLLLRGPAGWTARASGGTGAFAPTPFVEETEVTGLAPLAPLSGLVAERARSASADVGGPLATPLGALELNGTAFGSVVRHALQARDAGGLTASGASRVALANAPGATRAWGAELLARLVRDLGDERSARLTASYTYLRATECDPDASAPDGVCVRRDVPLNPRHAFGVVASVEAEGRGRVGIELYRTGRQALERDPYRTESRPYVVVGVLAERQVGAARLFVNAENLGDVRQTRVDLLVLPRRGQGGRWTTPVWSLLEGRTVNGGVKLRF